ncbi:unnamed protein product [Blepharisma stoltei]|uniref:RING-type domain-containing protein n=1 Tax=Blepharisma stoltei TaxID=1481888 RepID=A0AAU9JW92_9CILI|nr:unnamed protein product [Blepharisma stoltei]
MNAIFNNFFWTVIISATLSKGQDHSSDKDDGIRVSEGQIIGIILGTIGFFIFCGLITYIIVKYKCGAASAESFQDIASENVIQSNQVEQNYMVYLESESSLIHRESEIQQINGENLELWRSLDREAENLQPEESQTPEINSESSTPSSINSETPNPASIDSEKKNLVEKAKPKKKEDSKCKEFSIAYQKTCSICLNDFKVGEYLKKTKCDHLFHIWCLDEWANNSKQLTCPVCREDILKKP